MVLADSLAHSGGHERVYQEARAVITAAVGLSAALMENLPRLEFIQTVGSGYNAVDLEAAARRGIVVANNPGQNAKAVAEHALMSALYFVRRMGECHQLVAEGRFAERFRLTGEGLRDTTGLTMGIVGLGHIGQALVRMALPHEMRFLYYQRTRRPDLESQWGVEYQSLTALLAQSDIVVVTLPLSAATRNLIGAAELASMKMGSILINVGRGGVVDNQALADALVRGPLYAASLDVFEPEPIPPDHPLLMLPDSVRPRVLFSPHIAGLTLQAFHNMVAGAFANVDRYFRGEPVHHRVETA